MGLVPECIMTEPAQPIRISDELISDNHGCPLCGGTGPDQTCHWCDIWYDRILRGIL